MSSAELQNRGVIAVSGPERVAFLQGLVSNDVKDTARGPVYACLLTPQGKFLHDMFIVADDENDRLLVDCERKRRDDLLKRLRMYKLRSKVDLEDLSDILRVYAFWGDDAGRGYADPRLDDLGARLIAENADVAGDMAAYDAHRLALGVPDGSRDLKIEGSTLIEGNIDLLNGISWDKGCYTGQELTARMHYRGLAKKRLFPVRAVGGDLPEHAEITKDGKNVGETRSACGAIGLALLKLDALDGPLTTGDLALSVDIPAWLEPALAA